MFVVNLNAEPQTIQSWDERWELFDYLAVLAEGLDLTAYYKYDGFVTYVIEEIDGVKTVVSYTPDIEAWEEWKKNNPDKPEPEPEPDPDEDGDDASYDEMAAAIREGVNEV